MLATYKEKGKKIKERVYLLFSNDNFLSLQGPTGLLAIQIQYNTIQYDVLYFERVDT